MSAEPTATLAGVIGAVPYRMALAGGWIDQPFVSRHNPRPPGSMVVVGLEPVVRFMDRAGMATGTRHVATRLWHGVLPPGDPAQLVRQLYAAENQGRPEPSGSQDMIGLVYPGINRLDYDFGFEGGVFPRQIETCRDPAVASWLESVVHVIPVLPRPEGYNPLVEKHLDPKVIQRLGASGQACYTAILGRNLRALGQAMNDCMECWATLLPATVRHPSIPLDLAALLKVYQSRYPGAMYSGCGGGYLYVASDAPVPGSFSLKVRI